MPQHRIYRMKFSSVYPMYVQKAERKNRTKNEVDQIICWLTGKNTAAMIHLHVGIQGRHFAGWHYHRCRV